MAKIARGACGRVYLLGSASAGETANGPGTAQEIDVKHKTFQFIFDGGGSVKLELSLDGSNWRDLTPDAFIGDDTWKSNDYLPWIRANKLTGTEPVRVIMAYCD